MMTERPLGDESGDMLGSSAADCAIGMTTVMRSGSSCFLFVFVRQALVPVGHFGCERCVTCKACSNMAVCTNLIALLYPIKQLQVCTQIKSQRVDRGAGWGVSGALEGMLACER